MHFVSADETTTHHTPTDFHPLASTFEELVTRGFYADKTGLMEELLSEKNLSKVVLITYPTGFGKSVNIQMLAAYLQIPVDPEGKVVKYKNAHLFDKWRIKDAQLLKQNYQGKHPVLKISLGPASERSFKEMRDSFIQHVLRGAETGLYFQHRYMIPILKKKSENNSLPEMDRREYKRQLAYFEKMYDGPTENITDMDLEVSFKFLCIILCEEYGKKAFIFVDEYDHPLNEAWFKCDNVERELILEFFERLFLLTFKEENAALQQAVITGILRYAKANLFTSLSNVTEYNMLNNPYFKYYGFTTDDVDHLAKIRGGITKEMQEEAKQYYDGYRTANDFKFHIFNTWAMSCFFQHRAVAPYFKQSGIHERFSTVFGHELIWRDLRNLVDGDAISITELDFLVMSTDSFERLLSMTNPQHEPVDKNMFYKLLLSTGYLTLDGTKNAGKPLMEIGRNAFLRIPNKAGRMDLSKILIENDPHISRSQYSAFSDAGRHVESMFLRENFEESVKDFKKSLQEILGGFGIFTLEKPSKINAAEKYVFLGEELIHSIVGGLSLTINAKYIDMEIPVNLSRDRADLLIIYPRLNKVIVFGFKRNSCKSEALAKKATEAAAQARGYTHLLKDTCYSIRHVMCVGVAVSVEKEVHIETYVDALV